MPTFPTITSPPQAQAEVLVNEALETLEHQAVYGYRHETTSGLTVGYYGGRWGGFSVAAGTFTLAGSSTSYEVVAKATGVPTVSTSATNWSNTTDYAHVYKYTTSSGAITVIEDHRVGPNGVMGSGASSAASSFAAVVAVSGTTRNLDADDAGCYLRFTNAGTKTLTVLDDATEPLAVNSEFHGRNVGAGALTIAAGNTDVIIHEPAGGSNVVPQGGTFTLKRVGTDEFDLFGVTSP